MVNPNKKENGYYLVESSLDITQCEELVDKTNTLLFRLYAIIFLKRLLQIQLPEKCISSCVPF